MKRSPMPRPTKPMARTSELPRTAGLSRKGRLNPVSKKRAAANRVRRKVVDALFPDRPECAVQGCIRLADDVHEPLTRGRGGSIVDPENMQPLCRTCHTLITDEQPAWAYDLGLLLHSWPGDAA